ncbi:MAG: segregation/condensation protein A [Azoarcus sp.]|uniref:Segregation and condensation protein A n=1 Tax=Parazoarcus communis TaxID=41977 RepID=A0A2U8GN73_9RHOO|nr:ScpA family protein [Parazoarcus communis]AWI74974.1 segregation/condensation protein A [Parazoarcus communis]PLX74254.1 MAG: segregation/condensation protein A [Azoarcus sp.]TVT58761.1 MAG: segregation/condensation protein A [Azoarcus sp. PHD]|tara:strand:- start:139107 stop:139946 length:840 start_codon:yes stop_codon:yes gene_type:complete
MTEATLPLPLVPIETVEDVATIARLYGEPMLEMPKDLYIPPDALQIILDAFEGPLDLLLYLIRKANLNVLDIPMAPLTVQYLTYVEAMRASNLDLAADYLLMAAMLLEIKSRMLLPRPPRDDAEEEDPRAELVRRLLEYEQTKLAAARLDAMPRVERDFEWVSVFVAEKVVERLPEVSLHDLQLSWLRIMKKARLTQNHRVGREQLSVREHMTSILRKLGGGDFVVFDTLFEPELGAAGLVVSFLAVLELVKERLVDVTQNEAFAPIYVKLADGSRDNA